MDIILTQSEIEAYLAILDKDPPVRAFDFYDYISNHKGKQFHIYIVHIDKNTVCVFIYHKKAITVIYDYHVFIKDGTVRKRLEKILDTL